MVAGILKGDVSKPGHSTTHTKGIMCTPHLMYTTSAPSFEIPVCPSCLHSYPLFPLLFLCPSSHPPFLQFIFQFAPRSSQVCARRKFAEAAGAPLEATWRRDRRGTIRPSPPSLSLPHVFSFYPPPMPLFFSFSLTFISTLSLSLSLLSLAVSSVSSLPGYAGPQGDLHLAGYLSTEPSSHLLHPALPLHSFSS